MYKCPVCKKPLTKAEYEKALRIHEAKEKHFHAREQQLERRFRDKDLQLTDEKRQLEREKQQLRVRVKEAQKEGEKKGIQKGSRMVKGLKNENEKLHDRIRQLEKGTTPHTEGLEFEVKLSIRLKREFPADEIIHTGKGGDILQTVKVESKAAGIIVYECKRTPRIIDQHIRQAYKAKQTRHADFAILVTTGKRRGFTGFTQIEKVLVISPLGVVPLASLLRQHLIEMFRTAVSREKRAIIADRLMQFIVSPQFKNPIEEVIEVSGKLKAQVQEEAKDHYKIWNKRWQYYQTLLWDSNLIRENLQLVLEGKKPDVLKHPKIIPLQIEAPKQL